VLDRDRNVTFVADALDEVEIVVDDAVSRRLAEYLDRVLEANRRFNLTAVRSFEEGVWLHVVDSLLGLECTNAAPAGSLADIGSGAGFPGVPLLMASGRKGVLIESVGKKARFLKGATAAMGIPARVVRLRAEAAAVEEPESYSIVTARALAPLPSLVELAAPLLSVGGILLAYKGSPSEDELERGRAAGECVGMRQREVVRVTLPHPEQARRALVIFEKTGPPRLDLPRRIGLAQNEPLA
jgi:16S rRNA (guanine527-N7)-methyltransferase